ncbi:MAG TPA: hypothetical protein VGM56_11040 [Byssovorax sp.]
MISSARSILAAAAPLVVVVVAVLGSPPVALAAPSGPQAEMAKLLGAAPSDGSLVGKLDGTPATFSVQAGYRGSSARTLIGLSVGRQALELALHRHDDWDEDQERAGHALDVDVGDAAFDAEYTVEGAPSDLVKAFVDAKVRAALEAEPEARIDVERDTLLVSMPRALRSTEDARRFAAVASACGLRMREGLRPSPPLSDSARAAEVARLHAIKGARVRSNLPFLIIAFLVGAGILGLVVYNATRRRAQT